MLAFRNTASLYQAEVSAADPRVVLPETWVRASADTVKWLHSLFEPGTAVQPNHREQIVAILFLRARILARTTARPVMACHASGSAVEKFYTKFAVQANSTVEYVS